MAFEDVSHPPHRWHEPSPSQAPNVHYLERLVEPNHEDREPHPERVNRRSVQEQQSLVGPERAVAEQPSHSLASALWKKATKP